MSPGATDPAVMTIAAFCRDQLLAHGPLTLDELAERASRAGVTQASNPRSSVGSAIRDRELRLTGDRWVTPLWLLEGRCLTTAALSLSGWSHNPYDTSRLDLALLDLSMHLKPLELVGGGMLRRHGWTDNWKCTGSLPTPAADEVLCFRVTSGALEVTTIPAAATWTPDAQRLIKELNAPPTPRHNQWETQTVVLRRLAGLLLADESLLRTPMPPLSVCSDLLAEQVTAGQRASEEPYGYGRWDDEPGWYGDPEELVSLTLRLSRYEAQAVRRAAAASGLPLDSWVVRQALDTRPASLGGLAELRIVR